MTVTMFQKYFLDPKLGGYWSHSDAIKAQFNAEELTEEIVLA